MDRNGDEDLDWVLTVWVLVGESPLHLGSDIRYHARHVWKLEATVNDLSIVYTKDEGVIVPERYCKGKV